MIKIHLKTKDKYSYWAERGSYSDLFMRHLADGKRKISGGQSVLQDYKRLAEGHGWEIIVEDAE